MKECRDCKAVKPLSDFYPAKNGSMGVASYCRPCNILRTKRHYRSLTPEQRRERSLKNSFGITFAEYDQIRQRQSGACAICREPDDRPDGGLYVDHDHETGRIRGLLCNRCNLGIGHFKDDPKALLNAAAYLEAVLV